MKNNKNRKAIKKVSILIVVLMISMLFTACGSSYDKGLYEDTYDANYDYNGFSDNASYDESKSSSGESQVPEGQIGSDGQNYEQKLIKTYNYTFETEEYDKSIAFITSKVKEYNGYIERSETTGSSYRYGSYTIRIPKKYVDDFLGQIGNIGTITYSSDSSDDVTLRYYDLQTRIETLNAKHDRLMELLKEAENMEDIIALESELSNCEYEINSYTTSFKVLSNQIDYSTIYMDIHEVSVVTPVDEDSTWTRIGKEISSNTENVLDWLVDVFVFIVAGLPYWILIGIIVVIVVILVKIITKKSNKEPRVKKENNKVIVKVKNADNKEDKE